MRTSAVGGLTLGFEDDSMPPSFVGQYLQAHGAPESPFVSEVFTSLSTFLARDRWYVPPPSPRQEPIALVLDSGWCTLKESAIRTWFGVVKESWTALVYSAPCAAAPRMIASCATAEAGRTRQILYTIEATSPHGNAVAVRPQYLMSDTAEETAQDPALKQLSTNALLPALWADNQYTTTKTGLVPQILRQIEMNVPYGNALAVRLQYLMSDTAEETAQDPGLALLSVPSLTDFAKFLATEPRIAKPSLTLTWDGHVRAEWRKDADHRVAAEFMGDGTAKLVIFAPEPSDLRKIVRFSRQVEVSALVKTVRPYDIPFLAATT